MRELEILSSFQRVRPDWSQFKKGIWGFPQGCGIKQAVRIKVIGPAVPRFPELGIRLGLGCGERMESARLSWVTSLPTAWGQTRGGGLEKGLCYPHHLHPCRETPCANKPPPGAAGMSRSLVLVRMGQNGPLGCLCFAKLSSCLLTLP